MCLTRTADSKAQFITKKTKKKQNSKNKIPHSNL